MKKLIITALMLGNMSSIALAQPVDCGTSTDVTVMGGIAYSFGAGTTAENFGFTLKGLNTNEGDQFVVGAGGTYYPWSESKFGIDLSAGYNGNESTVLAGYDFLRKAPVISGGLVNTAEEVNNCLR